MEQQWNDTDREKPKNSERNLSSATLSTTNPTWINLGVGHHGEKPVTNCLSYGMALTLCLLGFMGFICISIYQSNHTSPNDIFIRILKNYY
jgi:hypothetical protein